MKRSSIIQSLTGALILSSLLTACGGRAPGLGVETPVIDQPAASQPIYDAPQQPIAPQPDYSNPNNGYNNPSGPITTQPIGVALPALGEFKVDQSTLNDWQARGLAVSGGTIYIAAIDKTGISRKGTVLKMNATTGKDYDDLGSSLLGMKHKLDSTLQGVAMAGGNLFAIDSTKGLYSVRTSGGDIKELKGNGGMDIAGSNAGLYVAANGFMERSDMSGSSRSMMNGIPASAGIGSDSRGNIYFVAGTRVGMIDTISGQARDIANQGLQAPIDVAGDGRTGEVYVLEQTQVKRFSQAGQLMGTFQHTAGQPSSIAIDESGNIYIADFGSSSSTSKIVKYGPLNGGNNVMNGGNQGYGQPAYNQPGYGQPSYGGYNAPVQQPGYGAYQAPIQQPGYGAYSAPIQQPGYAPVQQPGYGAYQAPMQQQQQYPAAAPVQNNSRRQY